MVNSFIKPRIEPPLPGASLKILSEESGGFITVHTAILKRVNYYHKTKEVHQYKRVLKMAIR